MEARFESQSSQCSICDGQSGTGVYFTPLGGRTAHYRSQFHKDTVLSQRKITKKIMAYNSELANRLSALVDTRPRAHPSSCGPTMGTVYLSRGLRSCGVALTIHSHLAQRLKAEYNYTSTPSLGIHGLFSGEFHH